MRSIGPTQLGSGASINSVEVPKRKVSGQKIELRLMQEDISKIYVSFVQKTEETH